MACMRLLLVTCRLRDDTEQSFYLKTDATEQEILEEQAMLVMPTVIRDSKQVSHIAMFETAFLFMKDCSNVDLSGY